MSYGAKSVSGLTGKKSCGSRFIFSWSAEIIPEILNVVKPYFYLYYIYKIDIKY